MLTGVLKDELSYFPSFISSMSLRLNITRDQPYFPVSQGTNNKSICQGLPVEDVSQRA